MPARSGYFRAVLRKVRSCLYVGLSKGNFTSLSVSQFVGLRRRDVTDSGDSAGFSRTQLQVARIFSVCLLHPPLTAKFLASSPCSSGVLATCRSKQDLASLPLFFDRKWHGQLGWTVWLLQVFLHHRFTFWYVDPESRQPGVSSARLRILISMASGCSRQVCSQQRAVRSFAMASLPSATAQSV